MIDAPSLRAALRALYDLPRLGRHKLAQLPQVAQRIAHDKPSGTSRAATRQADLERGAAVRDVLTEAIERLKPSGRSEDVSDPNWRNYLILYEQYVMDRPTEQVATHLCLERSTYFLEQASALEHLAALLHKQARALQGNADLADVTGADTAQKQAVLHNAPGKSTTILFGRDGLMGQVRAQLMNGQDVALFGLPGMGKSSLLNALAYDEALLAHFADGVLWAGLGQQADPDAQAFVLLGEWARRLGLPRDELQHLTTLEQRAAAVRAAIGNRRLLLVLDDAWSSPTALALRLGGPGCAHLLSTRTQAVAHDFGGRNVWPVPELNAEDSLAVLAEQAPEVVQHFSAEMHTLAERVGGLPLALRLMASYLRNASRSGAASRRVREALARLHSPETRLVLSEPTSPLNRHPNTTHDLTLAEVIGLSEAFLDEAARRALYALSVFPAKPNSFDEAAALAVCTGMSTIHSKKRFVKTPCFPAFGEFACLESRYLVHHFDSADDENACFSRA
jgi:hypothetical protein